MEKRKSLEEELWDEVRKVFYQRSNEWTIRNLLEKKPDVDFKKNGLTLLYAAIRLTWLVELLIKYGADVNSENGPEGVTPLYHAIELNDVQTVKLLLKNGAKYIGPRPIPELVLRNLVVGSEDTPEEKRNLVIEILELLKKHLGIDYLLKNATPLHHEHIEWLIEPVYMHPEIVKWFLDNGVNPLEKNTRGETALKNLRRIRQEKSWSKEEVARWNQSEELLLTPEMEKEMETSDLSLRRIREDFSGPVPKEVRKFITWQGQYMRVCDDVESGAMPSSDLRAFARILGLDPTGFQSKGELCTAVMAKMAEKIPSMYRK